jgi:hypothetical protein
LEAEKEEGEDPTDEGGVEVPSSIVEQSVVESVEHLSGSFLTSDRSNKTTCCGQGVVPVNFENGTLGTRGPTPKYPEIPCELAKIAENRRY